MALAQDVLNLMKANYRDGVESLLTRNSPVFREITKMRLSGETYEWPAVYGRSPAVSSSFLTSSDLALTSTDRNARWKLDLTRQQMFASYTLNAKEIPATASERGAFAPILKTRTFAALEGLRKQLAASLYSPGFGCFGYIDTAYTAGALSLTVKDSSILLKIDIGSQFQFADPSTYVPAGAVYQVATVDESNNSFTFTVVSGTDAAATAGTALVYYGSIDGTTSLSPWGLDAWLPVNTANAPATFCNVNRSLAWDRLGGHRVIRNSLPAANNKISDAMTEAIRKARRGGGNPDFIVMNDVNVAELMAELKAMGTQWQSEDTGSAKPRVASFGHDQIGFAFMSNWIKNIVDDPYCPYNKAYVLEKDQFKYVCYTNWGKVDQNTNTTAPGRGDPLAETTHGEEPQKILIDDVVNIQDGVKTIDGPGVLVSFLLYGTFACFNPAGCTVVDLNT